MNEKEIHYTEEEQHTIEKVLNRIREDIEAEELRERIIYEKELKEST